MRNHDECSRGYHRNSKAWYAGAVGDQYAMPSKHDLQWQEKHPLDVNFWWDIENDLMFWGENNDFEVKFQNAIASK